MLLGPLWLASSRFETYKKRREHKPGANTRLKGFQENQTSSILLPPVPSISVFPFSSLSLKARTGLDQVGWVISQT
jgi:hypothetical protein